MRPRIYLAGPDVFLPDAQAEAARRKRICARHGLDAVSPLDPLPGEPAAWLALPEWQRIHRCNEAHIRSCDALIANLTPFRGPSADAGTVYELGFMRALGRPVFAYSNEAASFLDRTLAFVGAPQGGPGAWRDAEGMQIEEFAAHAAGMADNLMIDGGIAAAGGVLVRRAVPASARWSDLAAFEACVEAAGRILREGS
jgi:nucleoside 2-deoxyribosyltransferase